MSSSFKPQRPADPGRIVVSTRVESPDRTADGTDPALDQQRSTAFVREGAARYAKPLSRRSNAVNAGFHKVRALHPDNNDTNQKSHYKDTEIGAIPDDWDVAPVAELFSISAGGDVNITLSSDTRDDKHLFPIYSNALTSQGLYGYCTYADHAADTITITARGTLGVAHYRDHDYTAIGRVLVLAPRQPLCGRFFASWINQRVSFAIESTGVPQLTAPQIGRHLVAVPPYREQRAIADILFDADSALHAMDRLIVKKRDLKQAAMQQLLSAEIRLPEYWLEWSEKPLKDFVAELKAGVSVNSTEETATYGSACVLKTSALSSGLFLPTQAKRIANQDLRRAKTTPQRNTILISRMNTPDLVGEIAYVPDDFPWLFLPDRIWMTRFHPYSTADVRWLAYLLSSRRYKERLRESATGTSGSMKNIAKETLMNFVIPVPEPDEQHAIAQILSDLDAEIEALERRREKTRALKQAMMQELLTGRTRLVEPQPPEVAAGSEPSQ